MTAAIIAITVSVLVLSVLMTRYLCSPTSRFSRLDHPNERSLHTMVTPRTGGLAIVLSLLVGLGLIAAMALACGPRCVIPASVPGSINLWIVGMALLVGSVSFLDDMIGLAAAFRLLAHILAAAGIAIGAGLVVEAVSAPGLGAWRLSWAAAPVTILILIWMTNLYNFMDGMDGFAGGMSVMGFTFMAFAAWFHGGYEIAILCILVAAASSGFLIFNLPPARVFMGDVGSTTLGFLAGAISLKGIHDGIFEVWVPILIFSPFAVDATATLLRRLTRGERVWRAHRQHYYQRLVLAGWGHRKTVLIEYALMGAAGTSAVIFLRVRDQMKLFILIVWGCLYLLIGLGIELVERRKRSADFQSNQVKQQSMNLTPTDKDPGLQVWWGSLLTKQIQFILDLSVLVLAFFLSYALRFDFELPRSFLHSALTQLPYVVLIQFTALFVTGVYSFVWRYISLGETRAFLKAALWSLLPILILRLVLPAPFQSWRVPLSIMIIDTLFAFGGVLILRVFRRFLYEKFEKRRRERGSHKQKRPVLLIGAGRAGVLAAREIQGRGDMSVEIRGFIDDDQRKLGSVICGIKVLGTLADLPALAQKLEIDHVVITIAQASQKEIRRIVEACEKIPIKTRIIPGLYEILSGNVQVSRIRDVQIEDLLGRDPVYLDEDNLMQFLTGKTVMVTGAGGSIGSELARQVVRFRPQKLLLVERAEFALFNIDRELQDLRRESTVVPLVADIGDQARMISVFKEFRPQVVFHAAAHKHVPMMESNAFEAIKNNVIATRLVGEMAGLFGVESFVMISTDKAVRPSSMMGASKRIAELIMQSLNRRFATGYVAVRFGNVIGSAGSVVPIFREQIRNGGPVTVTHPDMTRYFMTIPEAAQLVLQAGAMGQGGEILILDMGEPVRILDLARDTITLSGLKPDEDIEIVFTGIRAGEKLSETLEISEERMSKTRHPKIFIGKVAEYPDDKLARALEELSRLTFEGSEQQLRTLLSELIPENELTDGDREGKSAAESHVLAAAANAAAVGHQLADQIEGKRASRHSFALEGPKTA